MRGRAVHGDPGMLRGVQADPAGNRVELRDAPCPAIRRGGGFGGCGAAEASGFVERIHPHGARCEHDAAGLAHPQRVALPAEQEPARGDGAVARADRLEAVHAGERRHELRSRMPQHFGGAAALHHGAVVHHERARGQDQRVHRVVRDEHDRDRGTLALLRGDQAASLRGGRRVERGERLVQQQCIGLGGEGARDRGALLLPAGELSGTARGEAAEPHLLQPPVGATPGLGARNALRARSERHVLAHGQMGEQQRALAEQRDAPARRGDMDPACRAGAGRGVEHAVADRNGSGGGKKTRDRVQQRRLARSVRADDREDLSRLRLERRGHRESAAARAQVDPHRTAPARQPRTSTSTARATMISRSDSAIAVSSSTPAPLKAV